MAKKDVILRFAQAESDYFEMLSLLRDLKADVDNGLLDVNIYEEKLELLNEEIDNTKSNYFRWAEVMFELNKPNKKGKKMDETTRSWYEAIQSETRKCLADESQDPFKELKKILKKEEKENV